MVKLNNSRSIAFRAGLMIPCLSLFLVCGQASAQWTIQTINLQAGWNAVWLEVQPFPAQCEFHFDGKPVESVWAYDDHFSTVEFNLVDPQQPTLPTEGDPMWHFYAPAESLAAMASNLFVLEEGRGYLLKCSSAWTWEVKGQPRFHNRDWAPRSLNLRGFSVDPSNQPTFSAFLGPSSALKDPSTGSPLVYKLDGNAWIKAANSEKISPGVAYWVYCHQDTDYAGPVRIDIEGGTLVDFGATASEYTLQFKPEGTAARTVTIRPSNSAPVPVAPPGYSGELPPNLAGSIPLEYFHYGEDAHEWLNLASGSPATIPFAAGESVFKQLRMAVVRAEMASYTGPTPAVYQGLLEIKDGQGFRKLIGLSSEGRNNTLAKLNKGTPPDPAAGLWVGNVTLNKVSEPYAADYRVSSTSAPFSFRILLHVDSEGTVRLVKRATQMWRDGTYSAPNEDGFRSVEVPGRYVLVTPTDTNDFLNTLKPATLRDGRPFARTVTTVAYSLRNANGFPIEPNMTRVGVFGSNAATLAVDLLLPEDDPTNPFRHQYHPHHKHGYQITRKIRLTFSSEQPNDNYSPSGWGDTQFGGVYAETLIGLRADAIPAAAEIKVEGYFRLQRASTIPELNDGL